jgi:hypothetical protein
MMQRRSLLSLLGCAVLGLATSKRLMTWLCLEFCEDTEQEINMQLAQLFLVGSSVIHNLINIIFVLVVIF